MLLAFLGANILCAGLDPVPLEETTDRLPRRSPTWGGSTALLAGSFYSLKTADEGRVGMVEGQSRQELVRIDYPVIRVWPIDPETRKPTDEEYRLPFRPGNFAWVGGPSTSRCAQFDRPHADRRAFGSKATDGELPTQVPGIDQVRGQVPHSSLGRTTATWPTPTGSRWSRSRSRPKPPARPVPMDAFGEAQEEDRWITPHDDKLIQVFEDV